MRDIDRNTNGMLAVAVEIPDSYLIDTFNLFGGDHFANMCNIEIPIDGHTTVNPRQRAT